MDTQYRYYISKRLMHSTDSSDGGWRLPAKELEQVTIQSICEFLTDEVRIIDVLQETDSPLDQLAAILRRGQNFAADLHSEELGLEKTPWTRASTSIAPFPYSPHRAFRRLASDGDQSVRAQGLAPQNPR